MKVGIIVIEGIPTLIKKYRGYRGSLVKYTSSVTIETSGIVNSLYDLSKGFFIRQKFPSKDSMNRRGWRRNKRDVVLSQSMEGKSTTMGMKTPKV